MARVQAASPAPKKKPYEHLYFQVLCGMIIGIILGYVYPQAASAMKPLGDAFIKLIRMVIAPIIFCTVATIS
jgi:aerobic C4-dicarboxylate transport protein